MMFLSNEVEDVQSSVVRCTVVHELLQRTDVSTSCALPNQCWFVEVDVVGCSVRCSAECIMR